MNSRTEFLQTILYGRAFHCSIFLWGNAYLNTKVRIIGVLKDNLWPLWLFLIFTLNRLVASSLVKLWSMLKYLVRSLRTRLSSRFSSAMLLRHNVRAVSCNDCKLSSSNLLCGAHSADPYSMVGLRYIR